ncbi:MAG: ASCH domain-containing protein [Clostridia bacterium]|nr:ASCH domain-containing protein [Clostridia bacterium]
MKVISLTEPFATLIKEGKKRVETRSWKTNYRGELYIHASTTKIPKMWRENQEIMGLVSDKNMNYGKIICSCELVDCIYMDKNFVENMKNNHQEYICGIYEEGRYAWILENIKIVNRSEIVKGHLGIWNYHE